jgi:hypothetical protein
VTSDIDMDRTFELVMKNGLIIRLQVSESRHSFFYILTT